MVPCAQGRVIVETTRPAPPHFATCSTYRRPLMSSTPNDIVPSVSGVTLAAATQTDQSISKAPVAAKSAILPQSVAARPEDLGVTPWYLEDYPNVESSPGPTGDRSSYPSYSCMDKETVFCKPDLTSTRNSSVDSEIPRAPSIGTAPRKAYMDLRDAIALLDETCPNPEASPSLTPRTPRTPVTPHPRNKRARSKSSDNSSNYSNDRLSDRSFETTGAQDREKRTPFLKKLGLSKTEDRPFLAKLAPNIIGKPYLEKIGPSRGVERPFLDKIGSSKTLDKFNFDSWRGDRKTVVKSETEKPAVKMETEKTQVQEPVKEEKEKPRKEARGDDKFAVDRRRSGKGFLLKMYSFETEDLESTVQIKDTRDPLRGASLDDVIDSGPSSLPPLENIEEPPSKEELDEKRSTSVAELLKCRVTTSEEIIFSSVAPESPREANSWGNSPRRRVRSTKSAATPRTPIRRRNLHNSREGLRSDESTPNSPTKRPISNVSQGDASDRSIYSPTKTRRQTFEDILDRNGRDEADSKTCKQTQFERRGISSDNLLMKDSLSFSASGHQTKDRIERTLETSSEDSLATRRSRGQEYSKETFKQLQDKFKFHEIPTETYADFKRRTRGNLHSTLQRHSRDRAKKLVASTDALEEITKEIAKSSETEKSEKESWSTMAGEIVRSQGATVRSVLRKQEGIDHPSDHELDATSSLRRPKRHIFHEPSQETMDLLTELRKVKSLLKTPSWEKDLELEKKPSRQPKRILLTDKEFCLSVERENSIRRPSKVTNSLEKAKEARSFSIDKTDIKTVIRDTTTEKNGDLSKELLKPDAKVPGPALFEKKCLSLDYADEDKSQKPETRAISLASGRNLPSGVEETADYSELALIYDSKSCSSDVFNSPSDEINGKEHASDADNDPPSKIDRNHCADPDVVVPQEQKGTGSPRESAQQVQGRTGDLYEIMSPISTPFRVKKRLGKVSVEESVKPESFTLGSKVDCRSVATQKRTKCFLL